MSDPRSANWHFTGDTIREELKNDPLFLLEGAVEIKSNAVRRVFRNGGYYIKLDRRDNRSFKGEFKAACLCAAEQIPVVEHLAWGKNSEGSWLITRGAEGFVEAASLFKIRQKKELYDAVGLMLKKIFSSGIWHPDLHLGNVLVEPESGQCRLVDLHGVRKRYFFDCFRAYMMQRCIMEFRNTLSDAEMYRLIGLCGIRAPEVFFKYALKREAELLKAVTPKRRRQILSGYFKYTHLGPDGRVADIDISAEALGKGEKIFTDDASELFLFHFFLTQAKIPHRRVLAFDPGENSLLLEQTLPEQYRSSASAAELCSRLKYNGIASSEEDFQEGYLNDITGVFRRNR